jgi:hypothetical protein
VRRLPPEPDPQGGVMVHHILIWIANDATYGRTSINKEGDLVSIARQKGGTVQDLRVADILAQDAGGWQLLLR